MRNRSSKRVWLVIDSLAFGGIETHLFELAKGLSAHNAVVTVWFVRKYGHRQTLVNKLNSANIEYDFLDQGDESWLAYFYQQAKHHKPDVIHAHGYKASLAAKLIKLSTGLKQISTYHAGESPRGRVKLYDFLDRATSSISDLSIAVSAKVQNKLYSRSTILNNFIDTEQCPPSEGDQIAFVGRLSYEKAPDQFLELAKLHPEYQFHLYGDGPMRVNIEKSAPDNAYFHGYQVDMDLVWPEISILIISSRQEGLPLTAIEAMSRGIVVISMDVGDIAKLIKHQKSGYIAESVEQLNQALVTYQQLTAVQKDQLKSCAADEVNKRYSQTAVIPQLLSLYSGS